MVARVHEQEVNCKKTNAIKRIHCSLNQIKVPLYKWHYSDSTKELYRYHRGVVDIYAVYSPQPALLPTHPITFYLHHHHPHIRGHLSTLSGSILIEDAWKPHLQRLGDDSIMEVIAISTKLTPIEKLPANKCRLWLKIITISDIADVDGQSLQMRYL